MKKLTAGILASLIGLVSANSADAAVASTKYVEDRIGALDADQVGLTDGTTYIQAISETDGIITATSGSVADLVQDGIENSLVEGDGITLSTGDDGKTTIAADIKQGTNVTIATDDNGQMTISAKDTTYTAGDGVVISADNEISANIVQGTNVTITTGDNGQMTISATDNDTQYSASNGVKLEGNTFKANLVAGENISLTDDGEAVTINANFDTGVAGTLDEYTDGDTGLQVLTRSCTGEGEAKTCTYMWETIDRDYSPETQQEQPAQE